MNLYFVTGNKGKFTEVKAILPQVKQLDIDLVEIQHIDPREVIQHKLQEALKYKKGNVIVEDTSLYLEALNGLPGPLTKWFLKSLGDNGLYEIAKRYKNYRATAKTVVGYKGKGGKVKYFEGEIIGRTVKPKGERGFGWDKVFVPKGYKKTFAQMTAAEKNKISMRRIAFSKLVSMGLIAAH